MAFVARYEPKAGVGALIAMMLGGELLPVIRDELVYLG